MSKNTLARTIRKEIRELNWKIDMKIVKGLSYRDESRRHKFLLMQLGRISRSGGEGLFGRIMAMAGTFVF